MTRDEHLRYCKMCQNQKFDSSKGIICGLTNEIASFDHECPDYKRDPEIQDKDLGTKVSLLDNSSRAKLAINIFFGICIINVIAIVSGYFEYELLEKIKFGTDFTEQDLNSNDSRQLVIGIAQSILYIASFVTFLNWFRRAYGNLHRIGTPHLEHPESMAVWSFFIPFIGLYRPYKIAKEIAFETRKKISEFGTNIITSKSFPLIKIWWALFVITNIIGQIAFKVMLKSDTIDELITSSQAYMVSNLLDIPAAFVTLLMIKLIARDENTLFNQSRQTASTDGGVPRSSY